MTEMAGPEVRLPSSIKQYAFPEFAEILVPELDKTTETVARLVGPQTVEDRSRKEIAGSTNSRFNAAVLMAAIEGAV